ncbi:hypothetical protein CXIVA_14180 [Clostridium sp. SY8519]|nr:hypothetical protein CXIVA_14180 [Clostridium sp. SY8519]
MCPPSRKIPAVCCRNLSVFQGELNLRADFPQLQAVNHSALAGTLEFSCGNAYTYSV